MKRTWKIMGLLVGVLLLAISIHAVKASGQAAPVAGPPAASRDQKILAANIIRQINTAEVIDCRSKYGKIDENKKFLRWEELRGSPCFKQAQSRAGSSEINQSSLSAGREIVPGLELRLVVSSDGKHYNLWLGQNQAGNCGFAFYSDERGVIYEGRGVGCEAPAPITPEVGPRAAKAKVLEGDFHFHRGEYDKAIAAYKEALNVDPSNAKLRYQLERTIRACKNENKVGNGHLSCGEHEPTAPGADASMVSAKLADGNFHFHRGDYQQAIASYREGLKLDPSNAELQDALEGAIRACKEENKVGQGHQGCGDREPTAPLIAATSARAKLLEGQVYFRRGEYNQAITSFQEGLKLDPSNAELRYQFDRAIRARDTENKVSDEHHSCGER